MQRLFRAAPVWSATQFDRLTGVDLTSSLQLVLGNGDLCRELQTLMDATFTGEGLAFLQAFRDAGSALNRGQIVGLLETFILDNAPQQINVASETRAAIVNAFAEERLDAVARQLHNAAREAFDDIKRSQSFNTFLRSPQCKNAIVLKHRHTVLSEEMIRVLEVASNLVLTKKLLKVLGNEGDYYWSSRLRFLSSMAVDYDRCDSKTTRNNAARKIANLYLIKGAKFEFGIAAFLYENIVVQERFADLAVLRIEVAEELSQSSFVADCLNEMDAASKRTTMRKLSMSPPLLGSSPKLASSPKSVSVSGSS